MLKYNVDKENTEHYKHKINIVFAIIYIFILLMCLQNKHVHYVFIIAVFCLWNMILCWTYFANIKMAKLFSAKALWFMSTFNRSSQNKRNLYICMFLCCGGNSPLMFIVRSNSTATLVTALIANKLFLYFMHSHTVGSTPWTVGFYIESIVFQDIPRIIKIIWRNLNQLKTHPDIC